MRILMETFVNTMIQLGAFSLLPFIVYVIKHRKIKGFIHHLGFKGFDYKANMKLLIIGFGLFVIIGIGQMLYVNSLIPVNTDGLVTSMMSDYGLNFQGIVMVLLYALIKTSLAEEIFFRGFVLKGLTNVIGFVPANVIQSLLFAMIHLPLIMVFGLKAGLITLIAPFLSGLLMGYMNHRCEDSILPSYMVHAFGNLISFSSQLF